MFEKNMAENETEVQDYGNEETEGSTMCPSHELLI